MPKAKFRFDPAGEEVYDLMRSVIEERFPEIRALEPELRICVLMASNDGEVFKPCLKHHGAAAVALVRKSKPQDRAQDGPDVYIEIDQNCWNERSERGRAAILAHEIRHIGFKRDKGGEVKRDIYERPVIRLLPDDWMLTGFRDVVEWYGEDAVEYQAVRSVAEVVHPLCQLRLPFLDGEGGGEDAKQEHQTTGTPKAVTDETFAALISVGRSEQQAREFIDHISDGGQSFNTVSEMVEAIYLARDASPPTISVQQSTPEKPPRRKAEMSAAV